MDVGGLSFPSDNIGYGSTGYNVYKTTDGGNNWSIVSTMDIGELSFP